MHMLLSDNIVLGDDAYHSSVVLNNVNNSPYPAPDRIFVLTSISSYYIMLFLLLRIFNYFMLAANVPGPALQRYFGFVPSPNHCLCTPK